MRTVALRPGVRRWAKGDRCRRLLASREEPEGPVLWGMGGGGGGGSWRQDFWVWPLPPSGPLRWRASGRPLESTQPRRGRLPAAARCLRPSSGTVPQSGVSAGGSTWSSVSAVSRKLRRPIPTVKSKTQDRFRAQVLVRQAEAASPADPMSRAAGGSTGTRSTPHARSASIVGAAPVSTTHAQRTLPSVLREHVVAVASHGWKASTPRVQRPSASPC